MGWKNVKEHYKIEHIVCSENGVIKIGSPYIKDLIVIYETGDVSWGHWTSENSDLNRIFSDLCSDKGKLVELIKTPDSFEKFINVFTVENGEIKKDFCEELGWPNVTHSGRPMYDNKFSTDYETIKQMAKSEINSGIAFYEKRI
ncbi:MAG: hypothetical protein M0R48_10645, partial [Candidatus Omnitrophica bacterium]|nr:hypothetical protein [Candidatus Omnitrophota bacterium]